MAKIAIISYAEDEYDIHEVYDMTPEDFDQQDVKIYDTKKLKANINTENYTKTIDCVPPLVRWHLL